MQNDTVQLLKYIDDVANRYSRHLLLPEFSAEKQYLLEQASVGICGLGGLGSIVAQYIVGAGVGKVLLVDPDVIEEHNLHRQILYREAEVGENKAIVAAKTLRRLNQHCSIFPFVQKIEDLSRAQIEGADIWIDGLDVLASERVLLDRCIASHIPFVYGSVSEWRGMVSVGRSDKAKKALAQLLLKTSENTSIRGILGPVAGAIASMQVIETIKVLCGIEQVLDGKLYTADFLANEYAVFSLVS